MQNYPRTSELFCISLRELLFLKTLRTYLYILFAFLLQSPLLFAQKGIYNKGVLLTLAKPSDQLFVNGSYTSIGAAEIRSNGTMYVTDSLRNLSSQTQVFATGANETLVLAGSLNTVVAGTKNTQVARLVISKSNAEVKLLDTLQIRQRLELQNGSIELLQGDLEMGDLKNPNQLTTPDTIVGETALRRIYGQGGVIRNKRLLNTPGQLYSFGGLGVQTTLSSGALGWTIAERSHRSQPAGDGSILRYFTLQPTFSGTLGKTTLSFFGTELNALKASDLALWTSDKTNFWQTRGSQFLTAPARVESKESLAINDKINFTLASRNCTLNLPVVDLGPDSTILCSGTSKVLDAQNPNSRYAWSTGDTTPSIHVSRKGEYGVLVRNQRGCEARDSILLDSASSPSASFRSEPNYCVGTISRFSNQSTIAEGTMAYHWDFGNKRTLADTSSQQSPTYLYPDTGAHLVLLRVRSNKGCQDTATQIVRTHPYPLASFTAAAICNDSTFAFTNTSTISSREGLRAQWSWGDGTQLQTSNRTYYKFYPLVGMYKVRLVVSSTSGCRDTVEQSVVNTVASYGCPSSGQTPGGGECSELQAAFLAASDVTVGDTLLFAQLTQPEPQLISWDFGDGDTAIAHSPLHVFRYPSDFYVQLVVKGLTCYDTLTKRIVVKAVLPRTDEESTYALTSVQYVSLYPNPSKENLTLEVLLNQADVLSLQLISASGRVLSQTNTFVNHWKETLPVEHLSPGLYTLLLQAGSQQRALKFVKL